MDEIEELRYRIRKEMDKLEVEFEQQEAELAKIKTGSVNHLRVLRQMNDRVARLKAFDSVISWMDELGMQ